MPVPAKPKIYHIVHVDNLASIVADGCLWSDSVMVKKASAAVIGNNEIKADRWAYLSIAIRARALANMCPSISALVP